MIFVTLKMKSKSQCPMLVFALPWCLLCTKFSETSSNSSSDTKQKPLQMILNDFRNLENTVKLTRFELGLLLYPGGSVYQIWGEFVKYLFRY